MRELKPTSKSRRCEHKSARRASRAAASIINRVHVRYILVNGRWEIQP